MVLHGELNSINELLTVQKKSKAVGLVGYCLRYNLGALKFNDKYTIKNENYEIFVLPVNDDGKVHFEYLVVVMFDSDYQLQSIYELSWDMFLKFRKIKRPENKYFMGMNKSVLDYAKKIL